MFKPAIPQLQFRNRLNVFFFILLLAGAGGPEAAGPGGPPTTASLIAPYLFRLLSVCPSHLDCVGTVWEAAVPVGTVLGYVTT